MLFVCWLYLGGVFVLYLLCICGVSIIYCRYVGNMLLACWLYVGGMLVMCCVCVGVLLVVS